LNILFCSTALFLILSLPFSPHAPSPNIFDLTSSRLKTPTSLLFSRLAQLRPDQTLTPEDTLLRSHLTNVTARTVYLRFGTDTLLTCPFCSMDSPTSYLLYYLPFNTLVPHLLHLLLLGLVTSTPLVGPEPSRWRTTFVFGGLSLAFAEIALVAYYDPTVHGTVSRHPQAVPQLLHNQLYVGRLVVLAVFDAVCAGLIYLSATNRLFFTPPSPAEQAEHLVRNIMQAAATTTSKLHALSVVKNAVGRDEVLTNANATFWGLVRQVEESDDIWKDEGVVYALKEAARERRMREESFLTSVGATIEKDDGDGSGFISQVTAGLELEDQE
jgi:hypothetical protein